MTALRHCKLQYKSTHLNEIDKNNTNPYNKTRGLWFMVFNATFSNISVISWRKT